MLLVWVFIYNLTVGPFAYVNFCETFASRLWAQTIAIALMSYSPCGLIFQIAAVREILNAS